MLGTQRAGLCPQQAGLGMAEVAREGFTADWRLGRTSPPQVDEQLHQPSGCAAGSWAGRGGEGKSWGNPCLAQTPRGSIRCRMEVPLTGVTKSGAVQNEVRSPAFQGRAQRLWLLTSQHSCPLLSLQRAVTQPNRRAAQFPSVPAAGGAVSMEMSLSVLCSGEKGLL